MSQVAIPISAPVQRPALPVLAWLTPVRCRALLLLWILLTVSVHFAYLSFHCPIGLAEDEAYYWDWSRQLDYGYYSKGPATAWLIHLSCRALGQTMPAVRLPAILLGAGVSICIFWLTCRLFASERLGLGAAMLASTVPLLLPAGLVMTTDPPFLFCWALCCCLAARGVLDDARWAWPVAGVVAGLGFLTKFSMPIWFIGLIAFLLLAKVARPWHKFGVALAAFIPFAAPVILWNARHDWVTFRHVGEDVGVLDGAFSPANPVAFWIGQLGVVGPGLFLLLVIAMGWAIARCRMRRTGRDERLALILLLSFGLPVFLGVLLSSLRQHPSASWPMASYITLSIITAVFIARLQRGPRWRLWRWPVGAAILLNVAIVLGAHRTDLLYPLLQRAARRYPGLHLSSRTDPTHRLHGWKQAGRQVSQFRRRLGPGAMVMAGDYQTTAELAFYVAGQPRTYCTGSYFVDPAQREPFSQYDMWSDRRLDPASCAAHGLLGRDAICLGPMPPELRSAFAQVRALPDVVVRQRGLLVRQIRAWECRGFRGMAWPGWNGRYNK